MNKGSVERLRVHAKSLVGNLIGDSPIREVSIYLPASYTKSVPRRYPVLYLLHGFDADDQSWFCETKSIQMGLIADRFFADYPSKEMIIVMPNAYTCFRGSMYSNSATIGDWESFIAAELTSYVDGSFRTISRSEGRGLAGHSMGGYGALRIGMKCPETFTSLYLLSPCCLADRVAPVKAIETVKRIKHISEVKSLDFITASFLARGAAWSADSSRPPLFLDLPGLDARTTEAAAESWAANSPLVMLERYAHKLSGITIGLEMGTFDQGLNPRTFETLDSVLATNRITHSSEVFNGGHADHLTHRIEHTMLPFFSNALFFDAASF